MKVLSNGEHYESFAELREAFGLKPIKRTNMNKLNKEKNTFESKFKCKVCGAPLTLVKGSNVLVCSNPSCKGFKHVEKTEDGKKLVTYEPVHVLLNEHVGEYANRLYDTLQ